MGKLSISDFKKNNFMVLCIVAVGALMFIFIPEFIGMNSDGRPQISDFSLEFPDVHNGLENHNATQANKLRTGDAVHVDEQLAAELQAKPPLGQVAHLMDQGYVDHLVEKNVQAAERAAAEADSPRASLNPVAIRAGTAEGCEIAPGNENVEGTPEGLQFIPKNQITWANIKSRPARRVFQQAENDSTKLLKSLPEQLNGSRVALLNYISGLSKMASSGDKTLDAPEAIDYLNRLDLNVTKTLVSESAPRETLYEWAKISLSPVLGRQRMDTIKERAVPQFNPQPTLVDATYYSQADHLGEFDRKNPVLMSFKAVLTGSEIKKVTLEKDGEYFLNLNKKRIKDTDSWKIETRPVVKVPGIYTIVVIDKYENTFKKHYAFVNPPQRKSAWAYDKTGQNRYLFSPTDKESPRVDQLFRAKTKEERNSFTLVNNTGSGSGSSAGFSRF